MRLEPKEITQIKAMFAKMQSFEDLLTVLNYANKAFYGEEAVQFTLKQLAYYTNPKRSKDCYKRFTIKKKSGAERQIHSPDATLKSIQKAVSVVLQCVHKPSVAAFGFVWNRSIVDNAKKHVDSRYVFNIDLKDFFESIDQARVWKCLQLEPFNLNEKATDGILLLRSDQFIERYFKDGEKPRWERNGRIIFTNTEDGHFYLANPMEDLKPLISAASTKLPPLKSGNKFKNERWFTNRKPDFSRVKLANRIAAICCTNLTVERMDHNGEWQKVQRSVLPQGAPTSPVITNIVCQRLDHLLSGVAKRFGLRYTRYADDITFSSQHNVYQKNGEFITELHRIIADQGFYVKESKTRLQKDGHRKEVTGLLVHEKVNVQSRYIKQIRMWLYYWERYGLEKAQFLFAGQYIKDKGHVKKATSSIEAVLGGKLEYLKMVKGKDDSVYLSLFKRYKQLVKPVTIYVPELLKENYFDNVLDTLFNEGLDSAMDIYVPGNVTHENIVMAANDIMIVMGITSADDLNDATIKFKDQPEILRLLEAIVIKNKSSNNNTFNDIAALVQRSKTNVMSRLMKLPEYNCNNWYETSLTTIGGVLKNGLPIELVIRPGDGNKILLFYDKEFEVLENSANELWYDTGNIQKLYTFGNYLKLANVKQLPLNL
jgi:hypothetical protein